MIRLSITDTENPPYPESIPLRSYLKEDLDLQLRLYHTPDEAQLAAFIEALIAIHQHLYGASHDQDL